jgi:hypothetical protein
MTLLPSTRTYNSPIPALFCLTFTVLSFLLSTTLCNEGATGHFHHAERLLEALHDACATSSTPHHSTPHSAKYQVFAGIKIRQNVIPTNRQQQSLKSRQIFLSIFYHDFHQLVRHLD